MIPPVAEPPPALVFATGGDLVALQDSKLHLSNFGDQQIIFEDVKSPTCKAARLPEDEKIQHPTLEPIRPSTSRDSND